MTSNSQTPKNPHGKDIKCTIARHLKGKLPLQAIWHQIERCANVASIEKFNARPTPREARAQPEFFGGAAMIADACSCSYNTARNAIEEFVGLGLLTPVEGTGTEPARNERSGRWATRSYYVTLHEVYKELNPCPEYRFKRSDTGLVVKANERVAGTEMHVLNFGNHRPKMETAREALAVIELRETARLTFGDIGNRRSMSKGQACKLYHKYRYRVSELNDLIKQTEQESTEAFPSVRSQCLGNGP